MATLSVRPLSIRDAPSVLNLRPMQEELEDQLGAPHLGRMRVLSNLTFGRRRWRAFVALDGASAQALVAFQPEPRDYRWLLTELAVTDDVARSSVEHLVGLWTDLLLEGVRAAGASGAKRLHARPAIGGPAIEACRRASFMVYAEQTTLLAYGLRPRAVVEAPVREQEPSDAWSIHQLYHVATPHPIQFAEAFTSNHWDTGRRAGRKVQGYVIDRGQEVAAYCRVTSDGHRHTLDLLTLPGEAHLLLDLVPAALRRVGAGPKDSVSAAIAGYHAEYTPFLEQLGFELAGRHARMVRYTAVSAKTRLIRSLGLVPEVSERLSARLPSYSVAPSYPGQVRPVAVSKSEV